MSIPGGIPSRQPSVLTQAFHSLAALTLPSACALCGQELSDSLWVSLCSGCWGSLSPWKGALCARCGLPFAGSLEVPGALCAACRRDEPRFDLARCYGVYANALRGAVLELKFHQRHRLGLRLGGLLAKPRRALESAAGFHGAAVIVPVPLHPRRERERGYNQAGLLARGLARALKKEVGPPGVAVIGNSLVRKRPTAPQSGLSLHARRENVRGVFAVSDPERIRQRDVILVDDVMTTGATASACASALKRAGAERVFVLTVARSTPQFSHALPPVRS